MAITPKKIKQIKFGLLKPEDIRKLSVVKIVMADTYDEDGYPIDNGLMDRRLGVIDPGLRCKTCGGRTGECPGHFGHIELARPVIHVGYAKVIYKILRGTCRECHRILLSNDKIQKYLEELNNIEIRVGRRWDLIRRRIIPEITQVKVCPHCGAEQKEIKWEKPTTYLEDGQRLWPTEIRERLENIPDEDAKLLGFNPPDARPEWTILTVLPVTPVTVRPSITLESGVRSEDDLTHKLVDLVRINQRLAENIEAGAPQLIVEDLWELLQYHVTTYFDNSVSGVPPAKHRSGRPLRTLAQRLSGKEGRFRTNLSGKRVNFSARTVISPDPWISINEVGVPEAVARELTVPERVTERNLEEMKELILRGPNKHPGANYIIRPDGRRIRITETNKKERAEDIEPGYIVERHLRDGDIVLFNRQPSLHRMSIMAHEVRVMPGNTFRLNLCVCPPYNADFDGDEMNLHVPQTDEARAEARILMRVQEQMISPGRGMPIIGTVQDYVSGGFLLTLDKTLLTKKEALMLLAAAGRRDQLPPPAVVKNGTEYWTGKQIVSLLLPEDFDAEFMASVGEKVVIKNGKLVKGVLDKNATGALKECEITSTLVRKYGSDKAREFLDSFTRMVLAYLLKRGFTTGISDEDIPYEAQERINQILDRAEQKVSALIDIYERGELEPLPGRSLKETLEMRIMQELGDARDKAGEIAGAYLGMENHAVIMAKTGAKGSMLHLTQMTACLGQQSVRGTRIHRGYSGRSLPHFEPGDIGARARGFVRSSFKKGLSPVEFFYHAMGGREGLVDTAVRTAQSGYMQRRLINALQDLRVFDDLTVRDNRGVIVQFRYGEDGVDPSRTRRGKVVNVPQIVNEVLSEEEGAA
ncbi:MAG: DNA-directed RNA polymerase subunit A' [Methanobacteriota archaeon]|nr:MAG: DNA-directed RNA polymerase subunit A' [Euryarchaeota archaeon]